MSDDGGRHRRPTDARVSRQLSDDFLDHSGSWQVFPKSAFVERRPGHMASSPPNTMRAGIRPLLRVLECARLLVAGAGMTARRSAAAGTASKVLRDGTRGMKSMRSSCPATLGPLRCTRETEHRPDSGCVYVSGSSAPDRKAAADQRLEESHA